MRWPSFEPVPSGATWNAACARSRATDAGPRCLGGACAGQNRLIGLLFWRFEKSLFEEWERIDESSAANALRRECEVALRRLVETRPLLEASTEFLRHPTARQRFARLYAKTRARLGATVQRGIDSGELAPANTEHVAAALTALIEGLLLQALADPRYDPLAAWPTAWETIARGLARRRRATR